jgi:hypothetical protein
VRTAELLPTATLPLRSPRDGGLEPIERQNQHGGAKPCRSGLLATFADVELGLRSTKLLHLFLVDHAA